MLATGEIGYVFIATDSQPLRRMAMSMITRSEQTVKTIEKEEEKKRNIDSNDIRDREGMKDAVKDWYLIGEANYCMSTSIDSSTFAKTAIVRGRYIHIIA